MVDFVHLHNHSYYSVLDGLSSPKSLAVVAKELGYTSLALTDHGSCSGLYNFQKECNKIGIKPILGMEAYTTEDHRINSKEKNAKDSNTYHLIMLAKNVEGYKNLCRLSSLAYIKGFYKKPRLDFDLIQQHKEGLIISTACCIGELSHHIRRRDKKNLLNMIDKYKGAFGDDFYLEIMRHSYFNNDVQEQLEQKLSEQIYRLSKKIGVKCIATQDTHYSHKHLWQSQDVLLAIQTHTHLKNPKRMTFDSDDFYTSNNY